MGEMSVISRNKSVIKDELRHFMLSVCDEDIQQQFAPNFYTVEPLLMQLIREIRRLRDASHL